MNGQDIVNALYSVWLDNMVSFIPSINAKVLGALKEIKKRYAEYDGDETPALERT